MEGDGDLPPHEDDALSNKEELRLRLKAAVYYDVTKILEEECTANTDKDWEWTKSFQTSLADIAFDFATNLGKDLESFSKHAGRKIVKPEDTLLAARRNPHLRQLLADSWAEMQEKREEKAKSTSSKKRKSDAAGSTSSKKAPATKKSKKSLPEEEAEEAEEEEDNKKKKKTTMTKKKISAITATKKGKTAKKKPHGDDDEDEDEMREFEDEAEEHEVPDEDIDLFQEEDDAFA